MKDKAVLLLDQYGTLHLRLSMRLVTDKNNLLSEHNYWYSRKNKSNFLFLKRVNKTYKDNVKYLQTSKANCDFVLVNRDVKDKDELIKDLTTYSGHKFDEFVFWLEVRIQTKDKSGNYYSTRYIKDSERPTIETLVDQILTGKLQNNLFTTDYHASILSDKTSRFSNPAKIKRFTVNFSTEEILDKMIADWGRQYGNRSGTDYQCDHLSLISDLFKKCVEVEGNKLLELKDFSFYD